MIIHTVIGNRAHPEYVVTSPELAQQKFRLIALDLLQNDAA